MSVFKQQIGIPGSSTNEEFEVVVEGVTGSYSDGWIAVDDLRTSTGQCSVKPPGARPCEHSTKPTCDHYTYTLCICCTNLNELHVIIRISNLKSSNEMEC